MSAAKHTPGPWTIGSSDVPPIGLAVCHRLSDRKHSTIARFVKHGVDSYTELSANVALIAAAPELLALLIELVDIEGPMPGNSAWGDKALSIIAKATGSPS